MLLGQVLGQVLGRALGRGRVPEPELVPEQGLEPGQVLEQQSVQVQEWLLGPAGRQMLWARGQERCSKTRGSQRKK